MLAVIMTQILRGYKFRFYPTLTQRRQLAIEFGAARYVYNRTLREAEDSWASSKKRFNVFEAKRQVTAWRKELPWLKEASSTVLYSAIWNLDAAYKNWWEGRSKAPKPKGKISAAQSVTYQVDNRHPWGKNMVNGIIKLPKLGECRVLITREIESIPGSVTVSKHSTGEWFVTLEAVKASIGPLPWTNRGIGIDMGLKSLVAFSDGTKIKTPQWVKASNRRLKRNQRVQSRRVGNKKGQPKSRRWMKAKRQVARTYAHVRQERADFLHKLSTAATKLNQSIGIEDLFVRGMSRNRKLAPALANAGLGELRRQLTYKCQWYGRDLQVIGRFERTTGVCPDCGHAGEKLSLKVREWTCQNCGARHDRDVAAARVIAIKAGILPVGSRDVMLAEGHTNYTPQSIVGQWGSDEARTAQQASIQDVCE